MSHFPRAGRDSHCHLSPVFKPKSISEHAYFASLLLQQLEVVPLYGDMQIAPFRYVSQSPHYESGKWPHCSSSSASSQGSLLDRLQSIREEHIHYITKLAQHSNEQSTARHDKVKSDAENRDLYELALRGLNNLSKWTLHIIEVVSMGFFFLCSCDCSSGLFLA